MGSKNRLKLVEKIIERLSLIKREIFKRHLEGENKIGIGHSQFHILRYLHSKKSASLNQIADKLNISKSAATQMVDGLVNKGVLVKKSNPEDQRGVLISFSSNLEKRFKGLKQKKINKFSSIFDPLSDQELKQLFKLIDKIYKNRSSEK